jgi:hypothetical protein
LFCFNIHRNFFYFIFLIAQEAIEDYRLFNLSPIFDAGNELSEIFCTQSFGLALCEAIIFAIVGNNRHQVEIDTVSAPFLCSGRKVFFCVENLIYCFNFLFFAFLSLENYSITDKAHFTQSECYANYSLSAIDGKRKISAI